jgi:hypothetical protein
MVVGTSYSRGNGSASVCYRITVAGRSLGPHSAFSIRCDCDSVPACGFNYQRESAMSKSAAVSEDSLPFFMKQSRGVGTIRPEDDLLHPDSFKNVADDSATETQYFGFSIPEENIHALTYMASRTS